MPSNNPPHPSDIPVPLSPEQIRKGNATVSTRALLNSLKEYKSIINTHREERKILLEQLKEARESQERVEIIQTKLSELSALINQITVKFNSLEEKLETILQKEKEEEARNVTRQEATIPLKEIEKTQYEPLIARYTAEIQELSVKIHELEQGITQRDEIIQKLNSNLEELTTERDNLVKEVERLNNEVLMWESKLQLLDHLVKTDPRYKIYTILKKQGELTPVQLAFMMGLSLRDLQRYISDMKKINLLAEMNGKIRIQDMQFEFV